MSLLKGSLMVLGLLGICALFSGCALIQLPFQALGSALGIAGQAAGTATQAGMAAAPYAPLFL